MARDNVYFDDKQAALEYQATLRADRQPPRCRPT